jgi:L-tartrate/succinate antiporter
MPSSKAAVQPIKAPTAASTRNLLLKWLVPVGIGIVLYLMPTPAGLSPPAWHFFALFAATVAALMTEPIPSPAVGFIGVSAGASFILVGKTPAEAMKWALAGFSNDTVWLIMAAAMFALGYEKTGLGRRIALMLVRTLGKRTLGLGYAIAFSDLVLAPFMPSATARSGGTIYPVVKNIPQLYGSSPTENPRKIGAYLCWTAFATACVTSSMFVTSLAPNLLAVELMKKIVHVDITWTSWMMGFLPTGIIVFLLTPLLTYFIYPPEVKKGDEVAKWAASELGGMGRISWREVIMAVLAVFALLAWILGTRWMTATTVAAVVISLMVLTKVVDWSDIIANKQAWSVWVWFATLVNMADGLNRVGFLSWFANRSAAMIAGFPMMPMIIALVVLFWVIHYCFASATAHATAVLPVFLAMIVTVSGIPLKPVALMLVYSLGIQGVISPYAHGAAPIWYSAGYISTKDFWRLGAITGAVYLLVLLLIGFPFLLRFMR